MELETWKFEETIATEEKRPDSNGTVVKARRKKYYVYSAVDMEMSWFVLMRLSEELSEAAKSFLKRSAKSSVRTSQGN
jgi:transposase-like protein